MKANERLSLFILTKPRNDEIKLTQWFHVIPRSRCQILTQKKGRVNEQLTYGGTGGGLS